MFESMHPHPDEMMTYPYYRMVRFGLWPELLRLPEPSANLPLTHAIWRFARGMAFASTGTLDEAAKELASLEQAVPALSDQAGATSNSKRAIGSIALGILEGELAARRGKTDEAVKHLEQAAEQEDVLAYNEPPDWVLPARQFLGRILLAAGKPQHAEASFRKDLAKNPENGWSLRGLADALEAQKSNEAPEVERRFQKAWAVADVKIE
jgi:tetratricopeptide (TPR) repeat protein